MGNLGLSCLQHIGGAIFDYRWAWSTDTDYGQLEPKLRHWVMNDSASTGLGNGLVPGHLISCLERARYKKHGAYLDKKTDDW